MFDSSSYVNGEDDAQGRRRKGKARSTKGEEHDPRNAQAHSHAVIASSLMLPPDALPLSGKRKARRWVNERLLKDMAGPLTGPDVTSLYAPPPWGEKTERPVLERLSDVALSTPFEAFVCQQYLAGATFNKLPSRKAKSKQSREQASSSNQHSEAAGGAAVVAASQAAWRRVPEAAKGAMRRAAGWVVVGTVEALLVAFLQPPPAVATATTGATSSPGETSGEDGRGDDSSTVPCAAAISGGDGAEQQQQVEKEEQEQVVGEGMLEGSGSVSGIGSVLPEWCVQAAWGDVESALEAHGGKQKGGVSGGAGAAEGDADGGGAGRGGEGRQVLVFAADDAFLRLLLHGMCQFHGMRSLSLPAASLPAHLLLSFPAHLAPSTLTVAWLPLPLPSQPPPSASPSQPQELPLPAPQESNVVTADHPAWPSHHIRLHHILPACPLPIPA
ncbi:unnamed protein product [Closterium sp. Naga37s-1]|nr:unnamed protein product [Closterium sp. Naga37s-1]